jgi:hypothetical protein
MIQERSKNSFLLPERSGGDLPGAADGYGCTNRKTTNKDAQAVSGIFTLIPLSNENQRLSCLTVCCQRRRLSDEA